MVPDSNEDIQPAENRVLMAQLTEPEPLIYILTLAMYAEYVMAKKLRNGVRNPGALGRKAGGLSYRHLVTVTCAVPLVPADLQEALLALGEIRNRLAHDISHRLTDEEAQAFMTALPDELRDLNVRASWPLEKRFRFDRVALCIELMRCLHASRMPRDAFTANLWEQLKSQMQPE